MAVTRIASTDAGYVTGMLSLFPQTKDSKYHLYTATNNSETVLKQSLTYSGKYVIVEDNSSFPSNGLLRIGPPPGKPGSAELIYYDTKANGEFRNLIRGFAGSRQNPWPVGSWVTNAVFAEHHNACKDAIIQIERDLGTRNLPEAVSLNGILEAQERRFLAPRPLFRAFPFKGPAPLKVRFQNFSTGLPVRFLWDFGDGTTSIEKSPIHIFQKEGIYTVKLNVITSLGAQGVITKANYITVSNEERLPFFYVTPNQGYSVQTAAELTARGFPTDPTVFTYVDQSDGDIVQRYWIFDGVGKHNGVEVPTASIAEYNPNVHTSSYVYDVPGEYEPSLLILFESQRLQRAFLKDKITVT
jgi:PKD repeat protein